MAARANGRPPNVVSLHINPFDPAQWVMGTTFGMGVSQDCGATLAFICESVVVNTDAPDEPRQGFTGQDFRLAFGARRELMVEGGNAAARSVDGGVTWRPMRGLGVNPEVVFGELTGSTTEAGRAWLPVFDYTQASGEAVAGAGVVHTTDNSGASWTPLPHPAPNMVWRQLRAAAQRPGELTVVGFHFYRYEGPYLSRSSDHGQSWSPPVRGAGIDGRMTRQQLAVHPKDANLLWVGGVQVPADGRDRSILARSEDGGRTFVDIHPLPAEIRNLTLARSGQDLLVALEDGTLLRSRDGGRTLAALPLPRGNSCAMEAAGLLWLCGDSQGDGFGLAASADGGDTLFRAAMLSDLSQPSYPAGTLAQARCPKAWQGYARQLERKVDLPRLPRELLCRGSLAAAMAHGAPAQVAPPPPPEATWAATRLEEPRQPTPPASGCRCNAAAGGAGLAMVALALSWALRRLGRAKKSL